MSGAIRRPSATEATTPAAPSPDDQQPAGAQTPATTTQTSTEPGTGALGPETMTALQAVMAAEHAALWAYGLVAAHDPAVGSVVSSMVANHQDVRDTAANLIVQGGATPVGPAPAYTTPAPVTDPASALTLALTIESDCAVAWRSVIGHTDDSTLRGTALAALTDCAMRMVTWRQTAKVTPVTVPFPGDPERNG